MRTKQKRFIDIREECIPHHEETLVEGHRGEVKYGGEDSLRTENSQKVSKTGNT